MCRSGVHCHIRILPRTETDSIPPVLKTADTQSLYPAADLVATLLHHGVERRLQSVYGIGSVPVLRILDLLLRRTDHTILYIITNIM